MLLSFLMVEFFDVWDTYTVSDVNSFAIFHRQSEFIILRNFSLLLTCIPDTWNRLFPTNSTAWNFLINIFGSTAVSANCDRLWNYQFFGWDSVLVHAVYKWLSPHVTWDITFFFHWAFWSKIIQLIWTWDRGILATLALKLVKVRLIVKQLSI